MEITDKVRSAIARLEDQGATPIRVELSQKDWEAAHAEWSKTTVGLTADEQEKMSEICGLPFVQVPDLELSAVVGSAGDPPRRISQTF